MPSRSRFINDTYSKNPVNFMTADEQKKLNTQIKQKANIKCLIIRK